MRTAPAAAVLVMTVVAGVVGPAAPASAVVQNARVAGLVRVFDASADNSTDVKRAIATCPVGKQILGGGGWITGADEAVSRRVVLTGLIPYRTGNGRYAYAVSASETYAGTSGAWHVNAYASCSDPVTGHHIVAASTSRSSGEVKRATAVCPTGQRVVGTGAAINFSIWPGPDGRPVEMARGIGLQVLRADALGGLTRAQAREAQGGYPYSWWLDAYAVCTDPPYKYQIRTGGSDATGSENEKGVNSGACEKYIEYIRPGLPVSRERLSLNIGGALDDSTPGAVALSSLFPWYYSVFGDNYERANAFAYENTPTPASWDVMAQTICVGARW
jgi:hypothetical protein